MVVVHLRCQHARLINDVCVCDEYEHARRREMLRHGTFQRVSNTVTDSGRAEHGEEDFDFVPGSSRSMPTETGE